MYVSFDRILFILYSESWNMPRPTTNACDHVIKPIRAYFFRILLPTGSQSFTRVLYRKYAHFIHTHIYSHKYHNKYSKPSQSTGIYSFRTTGAPISFSIYLSVFCFFCQNFYMCLAVCSWLLSKTAQRNVAICLLKSTNICELKNIDWMFQVRILFNGLAFCSMNTFYRRELPEWIFFEKKRKKNHRPMWDHNSNTNVLPKEKRNC